MKQTVWAELPGKKRPEGERKHGAKIENRGLKNRDDSGTQATSEYVRDGRNFGKPALNEQRRKLDPKMGPKSKIAI